MLGLKLNVSDGNVYDSMHCNKGKKFSFDDVFIRNITIIRLINNVPIWP